MLLHSAAHSALWPPPAPDLAPAIGMAIVAAIYAAGARRAWTTCGVGRAISAPRAWTFAAGMIVLAIALLSPLDALSDELFAAHMTQHVLLAVIAPPLLVIGAPMLAFLWALPARNRVAVAAAVRRAARLRRAWSVLTTPLFACALHALAVWAWHAPPLYDAALTSPWLHALEHLSFLGTASLVWWRIVYPRTARRSAYAIGIVTLFVTAMQTGVLGALLTLSQRVLYAPQSAGAAAWRLSPLQDQQLAGLIMWVPGGLLYVVAMSALFVRWLAPGRETPVARDAARTYASRTRRVAAVTALLFAATLGAGCSRTEASSVAGGNVARGKQSIVAMGCGACHTIDGVNAAQGRVGPPLTGVASRSIIAGELPNTPENMARWIEDPPSVNPRTAMPNLGVAPQVARDIVAYLYTLR